MIADLPARSGKIEKNSRAEYGARYSELAGERNIFPEPVIIEKKIHLTNYQHQEVAIWGSAGMRIVTAGDIVCYAGLSAGMHVSMKNDYNITVLRGQSVSEILISPDTIGYAGITSVNVHRNTSKDSITRMCNR